MIELTKLTTDDLKRLGNYYHSLYGDTSEDLIQDVLLMAIKKGITKISKRYLESSLFFKSISRRRDSVRLVPLDEEHVYEPRRDLVIDVQNALNHVPSDGVVQVLLGKDSASTLARNEGVSRQAVAKKVRRRSSQLRGLLNDYRPY